MRVGIGSWVTLQPEKRGGHAKDAQKHSEGGYKARVMKFRFKQGSTVVQHVYTHRQVKLNAENVHGGCNYVGEAQRAEQAYKSLLKMGIYFYNAICYPKDKGGKLKMIPLPSFDDPEWSLPDMATSESFKNRLCSDFLGAMKPTGAFESIMDEGWDIRISVGVDIIKCMVDRSSDSHGQSSVCRFWLVSVAAHPA